MTRDEVIERLKKENRKAVSRSTGIPYGYLSKLVYGDIENPGHQQMDKLRSYLIAVDISRGQPR